MGLVTCRIHGLKCTIPRFWIHNPSFFNTKFILYSRSTERTAQPSATSRCCPLPRTCNQREIYQSPACIAKAGSIYRTRTLPRPQCSLVVTRSASAKFIIFNTKFLVFNTQFLACNVKFIHFSLTDSARASFFVRSISSVIVWIWHMESPIWNRKNHHFSGARFHYLMHENIIMMNI